MSKRSQLRQRAQNYLRKGNFSKAIDEYKRLLTLENNNPNIFNDLGDLYLKTSDRVNAVSNFEKATLNYEKVALYNNAVAVCKKILRIVPDHLGTIYKLGELKAKQRFEGEASNFFVQYLDLVLGSNQSSFDGVEDKVENILQMLPKSEAATARAADVFSLLGLRSKEARTIAHLLSLSGDVDNADRYRSRLEELKSSLSPDELESVEREAPAAGPVAGEEDVDVSAIVNETIDESEIIAAMDPEEPLPDAARFDERQSEAPEGEANSMEPGEEHPKAEPVDETVILPEGNPTVQETVPADDQSPEEGCEPAGEDLESELTDEHEQSVNIAEEITSDVEENDYKSHYDLGLAYLEMALYNEAVKEFQVAARFEQLQLKSLEMIGYCFLSQNNPRLAVKQLLRGLAIVKVSGGDSLGINYNLGVAYEMLGDMDKAREHFEEVYIVDVTFRDIDEKMKRFSTIS